MKKKLIQILMLLVVAVSIGAFVSCKDTNEDLYNELRNQTSVGDQTLADRLAKLQADLDALKASTGNCTCDKNLRTDLNAAQADIAGILATLAGLKTNTDGTIDLSGGNIGGGIVGGSGGGIPLNDLIGDLDDLKDKDGNPIDLGDIWAAVNGNTDAIGNLGDVLWAAVNGNTDAIGKINDALGDQAQTILTLADGIAGHTTAITNITNTLTEYGTNITNLQAGQEAANKLIEDLQKQLDAIKQCDCNAKFEEVWKAVNALEEGLANAKNIAEEALALAKADSVAIKAVEKIAEDATTAAEEAAKAAAAAESLAKKAEGDAAAAQKTADDAAKVADEALKLATTAAALEARVAQNEEDIKTLNGHITRIDGVIKTLEDNVKTNTQDIQKIKEDLDEVKAYKDKIKDNADAIKELQENVGKLDGRITTVSTQAEQAFQKASDAYAKALANETKINELASRQNVIETAIADLQSQMNDLKDVVNGHTTDINTLKENVNTINSNLSDMKTKYENITKEIGDLKDELANCKATCAENLAKAKAELEQLVATSIAAAKAEILKELEKYYTKEEIESQLETLQVNIQGNTTSTIEDIEKILENIKSCTCDNTELEKAVKIIQNQIKEMWSQVDDNTDNIDKNKDAIDAINQTIADLINKTIKDMQENIETLNGNVEDLTIKESQLELIVKKIKDTYITKEEVKTITDAIIAKAEADSTDFKNRMDIIGDSVANVLSDLTALTARVEILENSNFATSEELAALQDALSNRIASNSTKIQKLNEQVKEIKNDVKGLKSDVTSLQEITKVIQNDVQTLKEDFNNLEERVKKAENKLGEVEERLDQFDVEIMGIKNAIEAIQNNLAKQVTSITIQGTYNPMFGSFSLPTGTQSNILLAYYGLPAADVEFPTSLTGKYVRPSEALTEKDMEMLGLSGDAVFTWPANMPMMFDKGYAGKIWMTINPNTADVTDLQPTIVNSKDEKSFITLRPIKPSEEKLQFGWTRADQSSNGFYEAEAYVAPVDVQKVNAPSFNTAAVADAAKNVRDALTEMVKNQSTTGNGNMPRLEKLASDVNTIVQGLRFDRSALKVSYTSEDGEGNPTEHSVYSQYNLAATAFQPLNLGTAKDFNFQTVPGYEKVNALLDRVAGRVKKEVRTFFYDFKNSALVEKVADLTIKDIQIADLTPEQLALFKVSIDTTIVIDGLKYHLDFNQTVNVPVKFTKDVNVDIDINKDVEIDLSKVTVTTPTIVVTTDVKNTNGTAKLVVPVKDSNDKEIGNAIVDLDQVDVKADASIESGTITLDGTAVAKLVYKEGVPIKIDVDETFPATVNIEKWIYFGDYKLDADGNIVYDGNGNPVYTDSKSVHLWVTRDMSDAAESLWGSAQSALGDVNTMLDDIRDIVKEVNNIIKKINSYENKITGTVDDIVTRAKSYIDKINSVIVNLVNSTNERFQPFMVASTNKGMKFLSGSKNYPTKLTKDIKFFATSQTMELIVPMARKHVAVTNVFKGDASAQDGNSDCKSKLTAANSGEKMNVVLDGNERVIELNGLASGYVYEIAFSALDFQGKIATRKYYVTVE